MLTAAGYLMIKKLNGLSISGWLLNNAFHQPMVNLFVASGVFVIGSALAIKLISLVFEYFPPHVQSPVDPDEISDCLLRMNEEIYSHLAKIDPKSVSNVKSLNEQHAFEVNIRGVIEALAEHIRKSVGSVKIKRRDLLISLYTLDSRGKKLNYLLHYDSKRDSISSKVIDLSDRSFSNYECVKCLNSGNSTAYVTRKSEYARSDSKRYKTMRQYMGCKLAIDKSTYGFLNIEFHNHEIFDDEEKMVEFMLEHVIPFKLLLEYQFLKRQFFGVFSKLELQSEAA